MPFSCSGALAATLVHVVAVVLIPFVDHNAPIRLPAIVDVAFWRDTAAIYIGYAIIIAALFFILGTGVWIGLALFFPWGVAQASEPLAMLLALPALVLKLMIGGFLLAALETVSAKMRIFRVPEFLATAFLLAVLGLLVHLLLAR